MKCNVKSCENNANHFLKSIDLWLCDKCYRVVTEPGLFKFDDKGDGE